MHPETHGRRRRRSVAAHLALALLATPSLLSAQWAQGQGNVWIKSALFWQNTKKEFGPDGTRRTEPTGKEANSVVVFTDVIIGVLPTVDIWVQVPYLDLSVTSPAQELDENGFGDLRTWVRWQALDLFGGSTPVALRAGFKAPVGFQSLDDQVIPVGEGQWDFEVWGEIGHSFWPAPVYSELWIGYRFRERNDLLKKTPGDEFTFLVETGVNPIDGTLIKATLDGLIGQRWIVEGLRTSKKRRIITLQLSGAVNLVKTVWGEAGVRLPLDGQSFPAGPQLVAGFSAKVRPFR